MDLFFGNVTAFQAQSVHQFYDGLFGCSRGGQTAENEFLRRLKHFSYGRLIDVRLIRDLFYKLFLCNDQKITHLSNTRRAFAVRASGSLICTKESPRLMGECCLICLKKTIWHGRFQNHGTGLNICSCRFFNGYVGVAAPLLASAPAFLRRFPYLLWRFCVSDNFRG